MEKLAAWHETATQCLLMGANLLHTSIRAMLEELPA